MKIAVSTVREKQFRVQIDWIGLREMILVNVRAQLTAEGLTPAEVKAADFRIEIAQETDGSPPYPVSRWRAAVSGQAPEGGS